ncbi:hypothetical protein EfmJHP36_32020 (plasmid) [Enterococcus faecium]|nr:hypothetical protein EfmJHP36_32020 [Enterococcus faecium]
MIIKSNNGAEVLIHIGIDTVSMGGKGFTQKVTTNQKVRKGDILGGHAYGIKSNNGHLFSDFILK